MNPNGARAPKETLDLSVPSLFVEFRIVTSLTPNLKGRVKLALTSSHQTQEAARLLGLQLCCCKPPANVKSKRLLQV